MSERIKRERGAGSGRKTFDSRLNNPVRLMGTMLNKTTGGTIAGLTTLRLEVKSPESDKSSKRALFVLIPKVFESLKMYVYLRQMGISLPHTS